MTNNKTTSGVRPEPGVPRDADLEPAIDDPGLRNCIGVTRLVMRMVAGPTYR